MIFFLRFIIHYFSIIVKNMESNIMKAQKKYSRVKSAISLSICNR